MTVQSWSKKHSRDARIIHNHAQMVQARPYVPDLLLSRQMGNRFPITLTSPYSYSQFARKVIQTGQNPSHYEKNCFYIFYLILLHVIIFFVYFFLKMYIIFIHIPIMIFITIKIKFNFYYNLNKSKNYILFNINNLLLNSFI